MLNHQLVMSEFAAVRVKAVTGDKNCNRVGLARQAMAAVQWILLDIHKAMTGEIAEATVLNRRLTAIKAGLSKEIADAALHNPVSATTFGDRFDTSIRERAEAIQALRQVEPVLKHKGSQGKRRTSPSFKSPSGPPPKRPRIRDSAKATPRQEVTFIPTFKGKSGNRHFPKGRGKGK